MRYLIVSDIHGDKSSAEFILNKYKSGDFCKLIYNEKWVKKYLSCLKKEIQKRYMDEEVTSIYIGGGTPSSLDLDELKYLFDIIKVFKTEKVRISLSKPRFTKDST